jgi:cytochrome c oxidase subunit 2
LGLARLVSAYVLVPLIFAAGISHILATSASGDDRQAVEPRIIEVTAKRFSFEPSTIEVTQGESVRLLVKSADGPHGFAIEALEIDKEIARGGKPVTIEFTPKNAGEFEIACSVDCGRGHSEMSGKLVVIARKQEGP